MHPTCLPGGNGVGDLGPQARRFVDFLYDAGQSFWQILPLGPPAAGNSPYSAYSSFAGNRIMVSFEDLVADGFVNAEAMDWLKPLPHTNHGQVQYEEVLSKKAAALDKVAERFIQRPKSDRWYRSFQTFCEVNDGEWLDDFALYVELKEVFGQEAWYNWERGFRDRDPAVLTEFRARHEQQIQRVGLRNCVQFALALYDRVFRFANFLVDQSLAILLLASMDQAPQLRQLSRHQNNRRHSHLCVWRFMRCLGKSAFVPIGRKRAPTGCCRRSARLL